MKSLRLKLALIHNLTYPGLLINSVAIVILKLVNNYNVSMYAASWLEAYKDLTILFSSLLLGTFIPKLGYKKSLYASLVWQIVACVIMAIEPSITTARIFFVITGMGYAFSKISVYSLVDLITEEENEHASIVSFIEGCFMAGILSVFWIFSIAMRLGHWEYAYWLLAAIGIVGIILLFITPIDESKLITDITIHRQDAATHKGLFQLLRENAVWLFLLLAFIYVFVEQGITTWLPTYDKLVLHLSTAASVEIASLFAGFLVLGRLLGAVLVKYIHWRRMLLVCAIGALIILIYSIYLSSLIPQSVTYILTNWREFPIVAFLLPAIGMLIGPIYPTLCSSILSSHPPRFQSPITVLIVTFSALGGTIGSRIVGMLFGWFGGLTAIKVPIIPLLIISIFMIPYYHTLQKYRKRSGKNY